jgi:hypothetical protein
VRQGLCHGGACRGRAGGLEGCGAGGGARGTGRWASDGMCAGGGTRRRVGSSAAPSPPSPPAAGLPTPHLALRAHGWQLASWGSGGLWCRWEREGSARRGRQARAAAGRATGPPQPLLPRAWRTAPCCLLPKGPEQSSPLLLRASAAALSPALRLTSSGDLMAVWVGCRGVPGLK